MNNFSAIILAGGSGTRLKPAVPGIPKVLAPVNGRPFLQLLLEKASRANPKEFILCLAHEADRIRSAIGEEFQGKPVRYSVENEPMGTGGAIRLGLEKSKESWSLILNGDSFCHIDWDDLIRWYQLSVYPGLALVATSVPDISRFGAVGIDDEKKVTAFHEKNTRAEPGLINAGIYLLPKNLTSSIPAGKTVSWEREILPQMISKGLRAFLSPGPFIDIGTPESYARASRFFGQD